MCEDERDGRDEKHRMDKVDEFIEKNKEYDMAIVVTKGTTS